VSIHERGPTIKQTNKRGDENKRLLIGGPADEEEGKVFVDGEEIAVVLIGVKVKVLLPFILAELQRCEKETDVVPVGTWVLEFVPQRVDQHVEAGRNRVQDAASTLKLWGPIDSVRSTAATKKGGKQSDWIEKERRRRRRGRRSNLTFHEGKFCTVSDAD